MKPNESKIICCDIKKIHQPKPKKINVVNKHHKNHSNYIGLPCKTPNNKNNKLFQENKFYNEFFDLKDNLKGSRHSNLDSISLEEIENDFTLIKAKSENFKVENELLNLIKGNFKTLKENFKENPRRPVNPFYKNFSENIVNKFNIES